MNADKTIKKLKGESRKGKFTLYLSVESMKEFKIACQPFAPSKVIDELIKEFLKSKTDSKPKPKKSKTK